jgi:hypothetical protein
MRRKALRRQPQRIHAMLLTWRPRTSPWAAAACGILGDSITSPIFILRRKVDGRASGRSFLRRRIKRFQDRFHFLHGIPHGIGGNEGIPCGFRLCGSQRLQSQVICVGGFASKASVPHAMRHIIHCLALGGHVPRRRQICTDFARKCPEHMEKEDAF